MLSFKIVESGTVIQINLDEEGLEQLIRGVDNARRHGHAHLRTRAIGGKELDEKTPFGDEAIGEVIIDWEGDEEN